MANGSRGRVDTAALKKAANAAAVAHSVDVMFLNATLDRRLDERVITLVRKRKHAPGIVLVLVTPGGDADAAYRIARCLQDAYEHFTVLVPGYCKSAGTICVLGANEIVMSECGELGPLDVQFYKKDELGELSSGLVLPEALIALQERAFAMFEQYMLDVKARSNNMVTFKTATEVATKMAIGLFEPIFRQIDPMQVGEVARSMSIAQNYGERLRIKSRNFDAKCLDALTNNYPSHGFVIDRREAQLLFRHVRPPSKEETQLVDELGDRVRYPAPADFEYLSDELKEITHAKAVDHSSEGRAEVAGGDGPGEPSAARDTGVATEPARLPAKTAHKGGRVKLVSKTQ